ncbi:hypothetical protein ACI8AF_15680 [Blastococcus sp. SYSU D00669]
MPLPRPALTVRLLVLAVLVVLSGAAVVLLARYGLHRLVLRLRGRER